MTTFPAPLSKLLTAALLVVAMAITSCSQRVESSAAATPRVVIDVFGPPLSPTQDESRYVLTNYLGKLSEPEASRVRAAIQEHAEQRKNTPQGAPALYEPTACYLVLRSGTSEACEIWSIGQGWACKVSPGRNDGNNRAIMDGSETAGHIFAKSRLNAVVEEFIGRFDPSLQVAFKNYRAHIESTAATAGEEK
ncbi:hypothetical protein ACXR0O_15580 [Verrucomicrobiota bacterium sgz303538]